MNTTTTPEDIIAFEAESRKDDPIWSIKDHLEDLQEDLRSAEAQIANLEAEGSNYAHRELPQYRMTVEYCAIAIPAVQALINDLEAAAR